MTGEQAARHIADWLYRQADVCVDQEFDVTIKIAEAFKAYAEMLAREEFDDTETAYDPGTDRRVSEDLRPPPTTRPL